MEMLERKDRARLKKQNCSHKSGDGGRGVLMNVYAPVLSVEKVELWDIISLTVEQNMDSMVCIVGDFNSIRRPEERVGRRETVENRDMERFGEFISQSNLYEIPLVGRSFTWYRPDGTCKSKIDRIFVNNEWIRKWPNQSIKGLRRSFSDHEPLVLQGEAKDWGPRPFQFMNSWIDHPQFKDFVLKKKTETTQEGFARRNKVIFGDIDYNIESKKEEIEILDRIDDAIGLEEVEIIQRNKSTAELIKFRQWKEKFLAQKAKARWLRDGDVNSSYFHGWINKNRKSNAIERLLINDRWIDTVDDVKKGIQEHFKNHFNAAHFRRSFLPADIFPKKIDECSNQSALLIGDR
ncbi:hypothetical protein ACS0TY_020702 [Phlomoides rotata]